MGLTELEADLRRAVGGEVRFDRLTRVLYSTDASNYLITPRGVVCPRDADDVAAAVSVCAGHGVPIIPRGAGSGLAGQALGAGVILDTSRFMRRIAIDPEARLARVQPGAVLDLLNRAAAAQGLQFGPDPASADRATLGGIVATNATGSHSIVYGMTADHLRAADVVLADGSRARLEPKSFSAARTPLDAALRDILVAGSDLVRRDFPRYWRRSGGYNLDRLVAAADRGILDPVCLLVSSEGTLAVATELELGLVPLPTARGLLVAHFDDPLDPYRAVMPLLAADPRPSAIELIDRLLIGLARQAPGYAADVRLVEGDPAALLVIEYSGESPAAVTAGLAAGSEVLRAAGFHGAQVRAVTAADQASVWRVRKAGLGLLMRLRGDAKPVDGLEDTAVPVERLADYMTEVHRLLSDAGIRTAFYAHASAGCIHLRPILNLKTAAGVRQFGELGAAMAELVSRYGGVNSSEHGDGLARSAFNERLFGTAIYQQFKAVKAAFDPAGLLNPGKIVDAPSPTDNLRYGAAYVTQAVPAAFAYPEDGDLAHAAEQCNGMAVCRKLESGAMCPSYMVTLDERHSTRARANAVREALAVRPVRPELPSGHAGASSAPSTVDLPSRASLLASDDLADVMDLCVGCKACKSECPSGVDIARLKIEVSAARLARHGATLRAQLFAHVHSLATGLSKLPQPLRSLAQLPMSDTLLGRAARRLVGLAPERSLPRVADEIFEAWCARNDVPTDIGRAISPAPSTTPHQSHGHLPSTVVLFADTFTRCYEPEIGIAAVRVLRAAGYRVVVPFAAACCGRPALSRGLIDVARRDLAANVQLLAPYAAQSLPILVLEPSCASVFRDELPDLFIGGSSRSEPGFASPVDSDGAPASAVRQLSAAVITVEEFLAAMPQEAWSLLEAPQSSDVNGDRAALGPEGWSGVNPGFASTKSPTPALLHVHCHQRALVGVQPSLSVLRHLPGLAATEADGGCCGLAGSFGYEREHYAVSVAMAERKLAPAIRAAGDRAAIIADGSSCRQQIRHVTGRRALHPVEMVAKWLDGQG